MNQVELGELRKLWIDAVITFERPNGSLALRPCWFADHREVLEELGVDVGECEDVHRPQGAHWIKRQRVETVVRMMQMELSFGVSDWQELAAWDPRNGVCACVRHHQRFDSQRMPPLVVPRLLVPRHVVDFTDDWGLETALELKHPQEV